MKYRKKPVVIEALQINTASEFSIRQWSAGKVYVSPVLEPTEINPSGVYWQIDTLEGVMTAITGDWIIQGVSGEFYPCKPDIFEKTYEPADKPDPRDKLIEQMGKALRGNKKALDDFCGQFACQDCPILPKNVQSPACPLSTIMADADKALAAYKGATK